MPMRKRLYGLFSKPRDGRRWTRVEGTGAYVKEQAVRIFQTRLLNSALSGDANELRLRPIKITNPLFKEGI